MKRGTQLIQSIYRHVKEKVERKKFEMSHSLLPVYMSARRGVSSLNKRKVALGVLLLLPHADHHHLPPSSLPCCRSSSSFASTTTRLFLLLPWLPQPLFLATAPISYSARANSRIVNFLWSSCTTRRWRQCQARFLAPRRSMTTWKENCMDRGDKERSLIHFKDLHFRNKEVKACDRIEF